MSRFVCRDHKHLIKKARPPKKVSRTYKQVFALSKTMAKAVQVNLVKGMKKFKASIPADKLYSAWARGDYREIYETIPWETMPDHFGKAFEILSGAAFEAGRFSINSLPAPVEEGLRFDTGNPRIRDFMDDRIGELINGISEDARTSIQNSVRGSWDQAATPRQVADDIKDSIGLLPQHATAVQRYRETLSKGELPEGKIDSLVSGYADKLLDYRAMMIARTETRMAANWGQLMVWQQAADQGLIDSKTAKKVWVVDGNPCDICEPMDGEAVPLYGFWSLSNGDTVEVPSESHPHCMCGMEIDYGDTEELTAANTPEDSESDYPAEDEE